MPYGDRVEEKTLDGATLIVRVYDIPAIIAEAEKRGALKAVEEAIAIYEEERRAGNIVDQYTAPDTKMVSGRIVPFHERLPNRYRNLLSAYRDSLVKEPNRDK